MQIGSPEWISQSVQQLEYLEQQRDAHEVALGETDDVESITAHASALAELESQIETLYSQLDAVANQTEAAEEVEEACEYSSSSPFESAPVDAHVAQPFADGYQADNFSDHSQGNYGQSEAYYAEGEYYAQDDLVPTPHAAAQPNGHLGGFAPTHRSTQSDPAPSSLPDLMDDPFAMPAARPSQPVATPNPQFAAAPPQSFDAAPEFAPSMDMGDMGMDDDDFQPPKSGKSKWFLAGGALTVIAAVFGFTALNMGQMGSTENETLPAASSASAPTQAAAPPKVIQAVEVPPDTESPRAAVGAPVERTPSQEEIEKAKPKTAAAKPTAKTEKSSSKTKSRSKRSSKSKRSKEAKPKNKRFIELSDNEDPMG